VRWNASLKANDETDINAMSCKVTVLAPYTLKDETTKYIWILRMPNILTSCCGDEALDHLPIKHLNPYNFCIWELIKASFGALECLLES
jgi:hypothetical protein